MQTSTVAVTVHTQWPSTCCHSQITASHTFPTFHHDPPLHKWGNFFISKTEDLDPICRQLLKFGHNLKRKFLSPGNFFTCDDQKSSRSDNKNYEEVSAFFLSHFYLGFIMLITFLCLRDIFEMLARWTSACKPTTLVMWPGVNICLLIFLSRPVMKNKIKTFWLWAVLKTNYYSGEYPFAFAACLEQVTIRGSNLQFIYKSTVSNKMNTFLGWLAKENAWCKPKYL